VQTAVYKVLKVQGLPPKDEPVYTLNKLTTKEATLTPETDRAAANAAMECLIDMAKTRIAAAHRQNEATATVILDPEIDLNRHFLMASARVTAAGKVKTLTHRLNTDTGRAVTEFTLAVSSIAGLGIVHPETPTTAPDASQNPDKAVTGYPKCEFHSKPAEDHEFVVEFPGMAEADRAMLKHQLEQAIDAPVWEDEFTVST
jgi:hypothetical protein